MRFTELGLGAQTAYAELFEQTRAFELGQALAGLTGSFHQLERKGQYYWYFGYRDIDQKNRMIYVGPDDDRVRLLVSRFKEMRQIKPLSPAAQAAIALGCTAVTPKHFRIIKRLCDYGFFRAGGILVGTHAFLSYANMLGVKWRDGAATLDVDFAHAGRNVSLGLPASLKIDTHGALESLELGLLPISQFSGLAGAQYRNPKDQELRIDFLTSQARSSQPVSMPELNLALQPLKFMEFSLVQTTQTCLPSTLGACIVNVPAPYRYAVHKLIVYGERPEQQRTKSIKDLLQAASLIDYYLKTDQTETFNNAWCDALSRGKGWQRRCWQGQKALLKLAPELDQGSLWHQHR